MGILRTLGYGALATIAVIAFASGFIALSLWLLTIWIPLYFVPCVVVIFGAFVIVFSSKEQAHGNDTRH